MGDYFNSFFVIPVHRLKPSVCRMIICRGCICYEKVKYERDHAGRKHVVRDVFRGGEPDLPGVHGTAGRQPYVAGVCRVPDHRRGVAAPRCGGAWHQQAERSAGTEQPGGEAVRAFFHLCLISHHRTSLCDPAMCNGFLYRRD